MNAAVFPVPFFDLAITFLFSKILGMQSSYIGDGLSNPLS